jgi:two-component sensor histidine kinase
MPWEHNLSRVKLESKGFLAWGAAFAVFTVSVALHMLVHPYLKAVQFITFWPAIIVTTFVCGWLQGTVVLVLSITTTWYFFLSPAYSFDMQDESTVGAVVGFSMLGGITVVMVAIFRETFTRLEKARISEKALFAQLQHRVANNLQVVVSFLRICRVKLGNPTEAAKALNTAEVRIMAMAQMHRRLIDGTAYEKGLEPVLREVISDTFRDLAVSVNIDVAAAAELTIDQMAALTLLVSEAALNAAKHVFSKGLGSHFEVSMVRVNEKRLHLKITDDGPGISPDAETSSFGLGIMRAFATQLGGSLEIARDGGACLALGFDCPRRL